MWFGLYLVRNGVITERQFVDVLERRHQAAPPIGQLALKAGLLTMRQVFDIVIAQIDDHRPLGEIAISRGYMTEGDLALQLMQQSNLSPSFEDLLVELNILDRDQLEQSLDAAYKEKAHMAQVEV